MHRLIAVTSPEEIFPDYRGTPIGLLLEYHNLHREYEPYTQAQLLVGMCMDNRKHLHIPDNFSYIIRAGGANLRYSEFKVSYAIAVGGVKSIALIGHNQCGMVNLAARRDLFINGLVENAGWDQDLAEQHFMNFAPLFEIPASGAGTAPGDRGSPCRTRPLPHRPLPAGGRRRCRRSPGR